MFLDTKHCFREEWFMDIFTLLSLLRLCVNVLATWKKIISFRFMSMKGQNEVILTEKTIDKLTNNVNGK